MDNELLEGFVYLLGEIIYAVGSGGIKIDKDNQN